MSFARPSAASRSSKSTPIGSSWSIDNKSTDHTRAVVEAETASFPAPLRYVFEPEQGRYAAINTGIRAAKGAIIATTDDDARVERDWLTRAAAGLDALGCDYVGGKVFPIWTGPRPDWIPDRAVTALVGPGAAGPRRQTAASSE